VALEKLISSIGVKMPITTLPPETSGKTQRILTLVSGTSYTVPAGVTKLTTVLYGAGGASMNTSGGQGGQGGSTTFTGATTAPGGAGGGTSQTGAIGGRGGGNYGMWGNGTFANGEGGSAGSVITSTFAVTPGASISYAIGAGGTGSSCSTGGSGKIDIEYWV
jgi:hypothetical protein